MKHFMLASALCALTLGLGGTAFAASPQVVTVQASATALFAPDQITVKAGEPVELRLVGVSGVHGIASSELGISSTTITPGSTQVVRFTPTKPGTYVLHCTIPCGMDHAKMTLTIKVV